MPSQAAVQNGRLASEFSLGQLELKSLSRQAGFAS